MDSLPCVELNMAHLVCLAVGLCLDAGAHGAEIGGDTLKNIPPNQDALCALPVRIENMAMAIITHPHKRNAMT